MDEAYRTVLGRFRHEKEHCYWGVLIADSDCPGKLRSLFGDERISYPDALELDYRNGPPANWQENYISTKTYRLSFGMNTFRQNRWKPG